MGKTRNPCVHITGPVLPTREGRQLCVPTWAHSVPGARSLQVGLLFHRVFTCVCVCVCVCVRVVCVCVSGLCVCMVCVCVSGLCM